MANKLPKDSRSTSIKKRDMLNALEKALGVVTTASEVANINPSTHYDWLKKDSRYAKKVEEVGERGIDFAETSLLRQIREGNTTATIFYLKTKGKKRGWVERQELTGAEGKDLNPEIKVTIVDTKEE